MRYRHIISFESDTQPVETVRGEIDANGLPQAVSQGAREARKRWPKGRKFRSVVVIVERVAYADGEISEGQAA